MANIPGPLRSFDSDLLKKFEALKKVTNKESKAEFSLKGLKVRWFGRLLYEPPLYSKSADVRCTPTPLNRGEAQFVKDLKGFIEIVGTVLDGVELFLLRNLSRGRGSGFFEASGFHPDFIL